MIQKIFKMNKVDIKFQMWFQTLEVNGYIYFVGEHENKIKKSSEGSPNYRQTCWIYG